MSATLPGRLRLDESRKKKGGDELTNLPTTEKEIEEFLCSCPDYQEILAYMEGAMLPADKRATVERHLSICNLCRATKEHIQYWHFDRSLTTQEKAKAFIERHPSFKERIEKERERLANIVG